MSSGKSKSQANPYGIRRQVNGQELAPRSLRNPHYRKLLSECKEEQLRKAKVIL